MMNKQTKLLLFLNIVIFNEVLFCESARKVRYHKARNVKRKSNVQIPFNLNGISGGEAGDFFGFISYYRPENNLELFRTGEEFRNRTHHFNYGFYEDDIIPEYTDEDPTPSTPPPISPTRAPPIPKPLNVRISGNST